MNTENFQRNTCYTNILHCTGVSSASTINMINKTYTCRWYVAYALCANLYLASDHFEFPLNEKEATKTFVFRGQIR